MTLLFPMLRTTSLLLLLQEWELDLSLLLSLSTLLKVVRFERSNYIKIVKIFIWSKECVLLHATLMLLY